MPRALTRLAVLIVVLVVLLVAADRVSAYAAGRAVAARLTSSERLGQPASVTFGGVPFLTQALRGRYDDVAVTIQRLPLPSGLVVDRIDAHLYGVSVPPAQLVQGRVAALPVDRGDADVFMAFSDLGSSTRQVAGFPVSLTLSRAAADRIAVSAAVDTPFGRLLVRGQAQLLVAKGAVSVRLLPDTVSGLPAALRSQLPALIDLAGLVPQLPFGFRPTSLTVQATGLALQATGTGLSLPA